ncbi:uncharacterized protein PG986_011222 [Apiospora aurea]|uniref:Uncharacterized protein n=1 Tax=Apiospora aurea TaxID=335848 RepID=A0ABR1Q4Y6_9PEZI
MNQMPFTNIDGTLTRKGDATCSPCGSNFPSSPQPAGSAKGPTKPSREATNHGDGAHLTIVVWVGSCVGVIAAADGTETASWRVSRSVILAILGPLGGAMLQYVMLCGSAVSWWRSALAGTTLGDLHRQWEHGISVWAASTSWRHVDRVAVAKVMTLLIFVVMPLLQHALATKLATKVEDVILSTTAATDFASLQSLSFEPRVHSTLFDAWDKATHILPEIKQTMQRSADRKAITSAIFGCDGNCAGTIKNAAKAIASATLQCMLRAKHLARGGGGGDGEPPCSHVPRSEFPAQQETLVIAYESRHAYVWVALLVTIVATASLVWTAAGFESLGRPVSLSPLEIANAFGAPMLREGQSGISNMTVKELMEKYQDTRVQYLTTEEDDRVGGRGGGTD